MIVVPSRNSVFFLKCIEILGMISEVTTISLNNGMCILTSIDIHEISHNQFVFKSGFVEITDNQIIDFSFLNHGLQKYLLLSKKLNININLLHNEMIIENSNNETIRINRMELNQSKMKIPNNYFRSFYKWKLNSKEFAEMILNMCIGSGTVSINLSQNGLEMSTDLDSGHLRFNTKQNTSESFILQTKPPVKSITSCFILKYMIQVSVLINSLYCDKMINFCFSEDKPIKMFLECELFDYRLILTPKKKQ